MPTASASAPSQQQPRAAVPMEKHHEHAGAISPPPVLALACGSDNAAANKAGPLAPPTLRSLSKYVSFSVRRAAHPEPGHAPTTRVVAVDRDLRSTARRPVPTVLSADSSVRGLRRWRGGQVALVRHRRDSATSTHTLDRFPHRRRPSIQQPSCKDAFATRPTPQNRTSGAPLQLPVYRVHIEAPGTDVSSPRPRRTQRPFSSAVSTDRLRAHVAPAAHQSRPWRRPSATTRCFGATLVGVLAAMSINWSPCASAATAPSEVQRLEPPPSFSVVRALWARTAFMSPKPAQPLSEAKTTPCDRWTTAGRRCTCPGRWPNPTPIATHVASTTSRRQSRSASSRSSALLGVLGGRSGFSKEALRRLAGAWTMGLWSVACLNCSDRGDQPVCGGPEASLSPFTAGFPSPSSSRRRERAQATSVASVAARRGAAAQSCWIAVLCSTRTV